MTTPAGWETLGLAGDPTPGNPDEVRTLAGRLLEQAKLAEDNTAKLSNVSSNSSALRMRGDYAGAYVEALSGLPTELAKLGRAYRGAGAALNTYADSLQQAKSQAGTALSQGQSADQQYQGALREVRAHLPATATTSTLTETETAVTAADPAVQATVRPALQRARDADADRSRARRIVDEAARLRGDAERRATEEIQQALEGSGIQNKSWLEKAWDTVSTPFRSWDDFVNLARNVAMVAGIAVLIIGTGGVAGAILLGAAVVAGAVVFADSLNKYRQGKAGLGQVVLDGVGMLPGGRSAGLLAGGAKALAGLGAAAAGVRAGGGRVLGLGGLRAAGSAVVGAGVRARQKVADLRTAFQNGGARTATAASTAWQKGRQFFSKDPVHFPSGTVLLPQTDLELPGVLPLRLERSHLSNYRFGRWFGPSWASTFDQRLEIDEDGVCLTTATGALLAFPHPNDEHPVRPADGPLLTLRRADDAYTVTEPDTGRLLHFSPLPSDPDPAGGDTMVLPLTAISDRNGNRIDLRYTDGILSAVAHTGGYHLDIETSEGLIVAIRLREAGQTLLSYGYDQAGNLTQVINSSGLPLRFTYDEQGRMTRWVDRIGTWYAYTYDDQGRCTSGSGIDGIFDTEISYGDGVTTARDSLGHVTAYHYNELLQVVRETGPMGEQTGYRWDRHDQLLARTDPLGHTTSYAYDEHGQLTSISDALGHTRTVECNPAGLPTTITDPLGATTRYDRDAFGRVTAVTDPLGNLTRLTWTVEGRLAGRVLPGGTEERWAYDAENNLIEHLDALGQRTRIEVGPFDLPAAQVTPDDLRLEFAYDTELRLTRVTNPSGLTWDYTYDPTGNLTRESDFNNRVLAYRHDRAGRVVERINGAGENTSYVHDRLGRVIERRSGEQAATFGYDLLGRLMHAVNADAEVRFGRNEVGRIVYETCNGRTLATTYDAMGRRSWRRTSSGVESTWEYDAGGRPLTLRTGGRTIGFTHDPAGRETGRSLGPSTVLSHEWDADSRLRTQTLHTGSSTPHGRGARAVQRRTYTYRLDGQLFEIDDLLSGRRRFELDPVGRVTDVSGSNWTEQYAYDAPGRLVHATGPGLSEAQGERSYSGTTIRRAGRVHLDYDQQGRVVLRRRKRLSAKDQIWRYTWDADDRLTTVITPEGERWRYLYDALGRRIAKERTDGSSRVEFVWDGPVLVEQIRDGRATVWEWEPDTFRPISQLELSDDQIDERFYAIVTDLIGSPAELVDTAGQVAWRNQHNLWGASAGPVSAGADCPLRFPGQYADEESGLHYNLFRHYDPQTGAYLSNDPLGLGGGLVPHGYVLNPARWADPLGLSPYDPVPNRYPERLAGEKQAAVEAGVAPITAGTPEFGQAVKDGGYFLYSVEADDTLRIMTTAGDIKHPVMTDGLPVIAAGQVRFQYGSVTYIDNQTGHYRPERSFSEDFLQAGVRAFENAGIFVRRKAPRDIGEFL